MNVPQLAEKLGCSVTLDQFVSVGPLHATTAGLAKCQSDYLVRFFKSLNEKLPKSPSSKESRRALQDFMDKAFTMTLIVVCSDEGGNVTMDDEAAGEFWAKNEKPLGRLIMTAYTAALPTSVVQSLVSS